MTRSTSPSAASGNDPGVAQLGAAIVAAPLAPKLVATGVSVVLLIALAFLLLGSYARKVTVQGYLVPSNGLVKVFPPQRSVIVSRRVDVGDRVRSGDALFELRTVGSSRAANSAILREAEAALALLEVQSSRSIRLAQHRLQTSTQREVTVRDELTALGDELALAKRSLALDRKRQQRLQELRRSQNASEAELNEALRQVLDRQAAIQRLLRDRQSLQHQLENVANERTVVRLEQANKVDEYRKQQHDLKRRILELQAGQGIVLRATLSGRVAVLSGDVGQTVGPAFPLLSITPSDDELQARVLVPTRAIGFIHTGQSTHVRFQAFPFQRFGFFTGRVKSVATAIVSPDELHAPIRLNEPVYPALIRLSKQTVSAYGKHIPLQAGMLLDADIHLERHSLIQLLLDPLYRASSGE